jgi:hypothetical protein
MAQLACPENFRGCPCQLRLILWDLSVIIPFNPALRDSAAVPELWTLGGSEYV